MKRSILVSILVATFATIGLGLVFVQNASPYLQINQVSEGQPGVHVVGKIVHGTLQEMPVQRRVTFQLKDDSGLMNVVYEGPSQSNLAEATQVVVIGKKDGDHFLANQMLVKCPSKYESTQQPSQYQSRKSA